MEDLIKFDKQQLTCQGKWTLANLAQLETAFEKISVPAKAEITVDGQAITQMDSAGAWLLNKWIRKVTDQGKSVELQNFSEQQQKLLALIEERVTKNLKIPKRKSLNWLAQLGKVTIEQIKGILSFLSFIGGLTIEAIRVVFHPSRMRWRELTGIIYKSGYQALPIIALLSFLVGVVLAHQTGVQLQKYGANIFIVDLLGFSILREFGPLITAIMVAGRTGSAFTAQLGTMKINQEIDALDTMGVTPAELLLLPRILALLIVLPLLTMWADIFGILGGMLTTSSLLHINWHEFLNRFQREVPASALIIGLSKAPIFALVIASIGCYQGMQVKGNADSVGRLTTRSVVLSIFFVVVSDAMFSLLLDQFNL